MRPLRIPRTVVLHLRSPLQPAQRLALINQQYKALSEEGLPQVSVVTTPYKDEHNFPAPPHFRTLKPSLTK